MSKAGKRYLIRLVAAAALASSAAACFAMLLAPHAVQANGGDQPRIELPATYREWKLISVAHEAGSLNDIRAVLGNDAAFQAYRDGRQTLPEGAMIARLAYSYIPSPENNKVFGREQSFVAGPPTNIQLMVKDSKQFASTGGWGYAQFAEPKAHTSIDPAAATQCFACHTAVKDHDFVFTRYAP